MKKILIVITMIFLFVCALYIGLLLWVSIMGVIVGSFDWFPREEDIGMYRFFWWLSAGFAFFLEIVILYIEILLFKKLKRT